MDKQKVAREEERQERLEKPGLRRPLSRDMQTMVDVRRGDLTPPAGYWGDPYSVMGRFAQQMERLFDDFGFNRVGSPANGMWTPHIDVFEREGMFCVRADLPGMKKEDVKVDVVDDTLVLQGERRQEDERSESGYYRSERSYGRFYRVIPLPEGVDLEDVRAAFNDGVLEVTMRAPHKVTESRRRAVTIY